MAGEPFDTDDLDCACLTCNGKGGTLERQDPVGDGHGYEEFLNYCPDCLGEGLCPGCGHDIGRVENLATFACDRCGWVYDAERFDDSGDYEE